MLARSRASLARVVSLGMTFAFSVVVARTLGPENAGVVYSAVVALTLLSTVGRFGTDIETLRRAATLHSGGVRLTPEVLHWRRMMGICLMGSVALAVLADLAILLGAAGHRSPALLVFLLATPLQSVAVLCAAVLRGVGMAATGAFAEVGLGQGLTAVAAIALAAWGRATTMTVAWAFVVSSLVVMLWSMVRVHSLFRKGEASTAPGRPARFGSLASMMLSAVLFYALMWLPLLVLAVGSTVVETSLFGAAARLPNLVALIPTVLLTGSLPVFAAHFGHDRMAEGNAAVHAFNLKAGGGALVGTLVLVAGAPLIMRLFGEGFVDGANAMRILAIGQLVAVLLGPTAVLPLVCGLEKAAMTTLLATGIVALALETALATRWGATGAAVGWAVAYAGFSVAMALTLRRRRGVISYVTLRRPVDGIRDESEDESPLE